MNNKLFNSKHRRSKVKAFAKVGENVDLVIFPKRTNLHMHADVVSKDGKVLFSSSTLSLKLSTGNLSQQSEEFGKLFAELLKKKISNISNNHNASSKNSSLDSVVCCVNKGRYPYIGRVKAFIDSFNNNLI